MKIHFNFFLLNILIAFLLCNQLRAQVDTNFNQTPVQFSEYIQWVGKNNLGYASEKFNINFAEAAIESAKVFPDIELNAGGFSNQLQMGHGFETGLEWVLELGGKRKARINLAKSEVELSKYLLQDYFRNLRADATLYFLMAIQNKLLLDVQLSSYQTMNQLAKSDSIRFKLGSITQLDSRQSKLEAQSMLNEVFQAEAEWKHSLVHLSLLSGRQQTDTLLVATGNFDAFDRTFELSDLITTGQNNRADIQAALQNKNVSQNLLKLAKANRILDLGINAGIQFNSKATNEEAPSPTHKGISAGITIPLKFLNNRKGELQTAHYSTLQAETEYKQTELLIQTEITQAYYNYLAAKKQVNQFNNGLLKESQIILDGKIYSYQRGETSLLEVLNAQRTYNEIQQSYYQTLYNYGASLVELERAAGIWDINF